MISNTLKEFRAFALRGNVLDLAVGIIIGGAFGGIVNSMINDMMMPVVGSIIHNVDFSSLYIPLSPAVSQANEAAGGTLALAEARKIGPVFAYGNFITVLINFIILAWCIFMIVKLFNAAKKRFEAEQAPPPPAGPSPSEKLLGEIRDLLKARA